MKIAEIQAYPLHWPIGFPRAVFPKPSAFRTSFTAARDGLMEELHNLKATDVILSTNIPLRQDGLPYASYREPADKGVAVYFTWQGVQRVLACDKWDEIGDNMQALRLTVDAMRGLARWGASDIMARTFFGLKALPETGTSESWWEVLGVDSFANAFQIREAFHEKAKIHHPERGGDREQWERLVTARDAGYAALDNFKFSHDTT